MAPLLLLAEALGAVALGVISHVLLFIHGELDDYTISITLAFMAGLVLTIILISVQVNSILLGIVIGILLFSLYQLALGASILVYRVFLHRLSRFPTARTFVLSKWVAACHVAQTGRYFTVVKRFHERHGDFVRIGPCEISINHVDALDPVYADYSLCERGPWYNLLGPKPLLHRTRGRQAHDQQRVFWERGLNDQALANYIDGIERQVQILKSRMPDKEGVLNMTNELEFYSFSVMATTVFSAPQQGVKREEVFTAIAKLKCAQRQLGIFGHVPWAWFFMPYLPCIFNGNCGFRSESQSMLDERLMGTPDKPDLISWLQKTEGNPCAPGFPLAEESRLAVVSSFVTNAAALTAILFYISSNPVDLHELQAEVSPLIRSRQFDMRKSYPVLDSVINEAMRLQPIVPDGGQRKTPRHGIQIGQEWIPGDVVIKVPTYTIFRNERYFEEANSFIPQRWTKRKELVKDNRVFKPFSQGAYNCVAQDLALMEVRAAIAYLVSEFDFSLDSRTNASEFEVSGKESFSMTFGPLWIHVRARRV